jgi:putative transposon-encoded protein
MSKRKPIQIELKRKITIDPEFVFEAEVTKKGIIRAPKRFRGMKAIVLIQQPDLSALSTPEFLKRYNDADY